MQILEDSGFIRSSATFDAEHAEASIRELDEQRRLGDIEQAAYLIKKRALVRLYVKATTSPKRRPRGGDDTAHDA